MQNTRQGIWLSAVIVSAISLGMAFTPALGVDERDELEGWSSDFSAEKEYLTSRGRNPYFILEPGYQLVLEGGNERLEPGEKEHKHYAPGIGLVQDGSLKLVKYSAADPTGGKATVAASSAKARKEEDEDDDDDEVKINLADAPAAVQKTLQREAFGAEIKKVAKESEEGKTTYEAEVKIEGHEYVIKVAADGTLLEKELEDEDEEVPMKFAEAPAAVQKTLQREAAGAKIETVDKLSREGRTLYEADAKIDGKNFEIIVTSEGLLLSKKLDEDEEEEEVKPKEVSLPDPVLKTFNAKFPKAQIQKSESEVEDGVTVYDIEFEDGDVEKATDITADGIMLEFTIVIEAKAVPAAAMQAVEKAADGAKLKRIEQIEISCETKDGKVIKLPRPITRYAVEMTRGKNTAEIVVNPDGTVVESPQW